MSIHKPVLLKESIDLLNLEKGAVVVDATFGGGGHSREILKKIGKSGKLIAIDADKEAIENFKNEFLSKADNLFLVQDNFANFKNILGGQGVTTVDAVLADLGYSSDQIENQKRGFSFLGEGKLDMRFDTNQKVTAEYVINKYEQIDLERILKEYGEERFARKISEKIVETRKKYEFKTTKQLADLILQVIPKKYQGSRIHPATKSFQAIRIEVNQELRNLEIFINQAIDSLSIGGRLAVITFHSLEDRIVKNMFRENARGCICPPDFPICQCRQIRKVKIITKKPIRPSNQELADNIRSRSAKLRVCEKI